MYVYCLTHFSPTDFHHSFRQVLPQENIWSQTCNENHSQLVTFTETEREQGREDGELVLKGYRVLLWEDEGVLEVDGGDDRPTMYLVPFKNKVVNFIYAYVYFTTK